MLVTVVTEKHVLCCECSCIVKTLHGAAENSVECGYVLLFVLTALTTVAAYDSSVTTASAVSSSQTKRYVDIWSKASIG